MKHIEPASWFNLYPLPEDLGEGTLREIVVRHVALARKEGRTLPLERDHNYLLGYLIGWINRASVEDTHNLQRARDLVD